MVSSSSKSSVMCAPSATVRRFLCSMTRARNVLRSRAYASRGNRLSRLITGSRMLALHRLGAVAVSQTGKARAPVSLQVTMQLDERLPVHVALEVDHRVDRHPVFMPAPGVELRMT